MPRFGPSGFFRPSRYLIPTPGLASSTPSVQRACLCVYSHTHAHIHYHSRLKIPKHRQNPYPSFRQKRPPISAISALTD